MSWQLSKFVILKYILCYHIHLLYTLSNIWLICENKYVCHPADSCSLGCWRLFEGSTKASCGWKEGPQSQQFFFSRRFVHGSASASLWNGKHIPHSATESSGFKWKKTCLILKSWEWFFKSFIHTRIHSLIHLFSHSMSIMEHLPCDTYYYVRCCVGVHMWTKFSDF